MKSKNKYQKVLAILILLIGGSLTFQTALQSQIVPKVTICHRGHTIQVPLPALAIYLSLGDTQGPCVITECQNR